MPRPRHFTRQRPSTPTLLPRHARSHSTFLCGHTTSQVENPQHGPSGLRGEHSAEPLKGDWASGFQTAPFGKKNSRHFPPTVGTAQGSSACTSGQCRAVLAGGEGPRTAPLSSASPRREPLGLRFKPLVRCSLAEGGRVKHCSLPAPAPSLPLPHCVNAPHTSDSRRDAACRFSTKKVKWGTIWMS